MFLKLLSMPVQLDDDGRSPPNLVVEFDLMEFDWSHLCERQTFELGTASPPCPPWIRASINPLGLKRKDGIVIPAAIALFAMFCCKVICHENVAVCSQHPLWNPILEWLKLWNCGTFICVGIIALTFQMWRLDQGTACLSFLSTFVFVI